MNAPLFKLSQNDYVKGAVTAVFAAIITVLYGVVADSNFSVFQADWYAILNDVIQMSATAFIAYLSKNFLTTEDGKVAGF